LTKYGYSYYKNPPYLFLSSSYKGVEKFDFRKKFMKPPVLVTWKMPERPLALLKETAEVTVNLDDRYLSSKELIAQVPEKVALLCLGVDPISAAILEAGKNLKIVAIYAVGYNNIDLSTATRLKIAVTNTPDVHAETTADLTFALILAAARRVTEGDRFVRAGKWVRWKPDLLLGSDVYGKTLGIVGLGQIGSAVAKRAQGFNMKTLYTDLRRMNRGVEDQCRARFVSLPELLSQADFVTLHVPLMPETTHLIGSPELRRMKRSGYLINASRGPVVDEDALVEALQQGIITGAALDVFEQEPRVHPKLLEMENVTLLPHIGSGSSETRERMGFVAVQNVFAALQGESPPNILNPDIYSPKA
jgi:glyoxylate reductase